jgi:RNA polymerase sigma-70 factor (ECF subfamily)
MEGTVMATPQTPAIEDLESHRAAITGHCYRMLGSVFDAEDATQDTLARAWKALSQFDGRSSLRTWLYRISTNVCLDYLQSRRRRMCPTENGSPCAVPAAGDLSQEPIEFWIEPIPDIDSIPSDEDPVKRALLRESIRLAFVAALQRLPPKQRAVLLLNDVLDFSSAETAAALSLSVASVNSALQRARETMGKPQPSADLAPPQESVVREYMDAFERYDIPALTSLLRDDVAFSMPPYSLWLQGPAAVASWMQSFGSGCRGSRLIRVEACASPAFAQYRRSTAGGFRAWGLILLELENDRIAAITTFLDADRLFPRFGLPLTLPLPEPSLPDR